MKMKELTATIGDRCRDHREREGLTQSECATFAGLDRKTINRIENNHFSPSLDTLLRLAIVFGVTGSELIEGI